MSKTREARRDFWRQLIAKQQQSGVSVRAMCQEHADLSRMRTVLLLIAQLYRIERTAREHNLRGEELRMLSEHGSRTVLERLHEYSVEIQDRVLPKKRGSPGGNLRAEELDSVDALLGRWRSVEGRFEMTCRRLRESNIPSLRPT